MSKLGVQPDEVDAEKAGQTRGFNRGRTREEEAAYESDILKGLFLATIAPFVLLEVSTAGSGFVDALIVSQYLGANDLAVQGLANPYFSVTGVIGGLLVTGMQTLCTKAYGSGEINRVNGFFSMAALVGGIISVLLLLAFVFCGDSIGAMLGAVGNSADLLPSLKAYLIGLGIGTPGIVLFTLLLPLVQMSGGGRFAKISVSAGLIVCVVGDILAVVFNAGMLGIGLATSAGEWLQFFILLGYATSPKSSIRFSIRDIEWKELGSMVAMGLPKAIRRVANMLRPLILNRLVLTLGGSAAMSAMTIRNSLDGMGDVVGSGIAEVADLATFAIRCMAINLILNAIIESYINFLQATEQMLKTHIVNVASRFACVVVCALVLGSLFGINGVWLAFPVGSLLLIVAIVVITMVRKRSIWITLEDVLGLPADFGAAPEDTLRFNVTSEDQTYPIKTQDIYDFCDAHGFDRKKAFRTALCPEEMVTNIVDHGFVLDNKSHSVDVRIVAKGDELIVRVRDDCPLFNVREKGEEWKEHPDNLADNIGIRMTMASAKDLKYVNTLGTNTLIITV